jgi:hypothetical protein
VLLGHESLETTMIYTHVARKGPAGVAAVGGADRAVALGGPAWRQVGNLDTSAEAADAQAVVGDGAGRGDGLDLDSKGELVGLDHGVA